MTPGHHKSGVPLDPERVEGARKRLPSPEETDRLTGVLTLMSDPTRLRLLYALDLAEEMCVGDLALAIGSSEDATGYALRLLRTAGLVVRRKQGRLAYYRLSDDFPEPLRQECLLRLVALAQGDESD